MVYDVVIVGAGASGLMISKELSNAGLNCCVLEAASMPGGRIASVTDKNFSQIIETGAEFVHGYVPLTLELLRGAGITIAPVEGEMVSIEYGKRKKGDDNYMDSFFEKADTLQSDMSLCDFLDLYFAGNKFQGLRESITHYAAGFDLADAEKVSVISLRNEWSHEAETQYRIPGGYRQLIDYLLSKCKQDKIALHYHSTVNRIEINKDGVSIRTTSGKEFKSKIAVLTVSLGILQSEAIEFDPAPVIHLRAIQQLGFGTVIKFLLEFERPFWEEKYPDTGFFISNESIPTWWTQNPGKSSLLTGWLGGPPARLKSSWPEELLVEEAIASLSGIFKIDKNLLKKQLLAVRISNWQEHAQSRGGYSYPAVNLNGIMKVVGEPFENKIFFGGEGYWDGAHPGTVEAALQSGLQTARKIQSGYFRAFQ